MVDMSHIRRWLCGLGLLLLSLPDVGQVRLVAEERLQQPLPSQDQAEDPDAEFTFRVPVDVVVVNALVTDRQGHPVTDLTANDFSVYEDGRRQEIQTFFPGILQSHPGR